MSKKSQEGWVRSGFLFLVAFPLLRDAMRPSLYVRKGMHSGAWYRISKSYKKGEFQYEIRFTKKSKWTRGTQDSFSIDQAEANAKSMIDTFIEAGKGL